jgi:DNA-binding beta-propeller fold protein YncE
MWNNRRIYCGAYLALIVVFAGCQGPDAPARAPLSTGRWIDPSAADSSQTLGDMPMNMAVTPDGQFAVTTCDGYTERICTVRIADGKEAGSLEFPNNPKTDKTNGVYYGLAFGPGGALYAAQGAAARVAVLAVGPDGSIRLERTLRMKPSDFAAGVAVDADNRLYVTSNEPTSGPARFDVPASVAILDAGSGQELGRYVFADEQNLSNFPLAVAVSADGSRLYVGSERDDAVYVLNTSDPAHISLVAKLSTGSHPIALLMNKSQSRLYVANGQSDTISIVDTSIAKIVGTVLVRPDVAKDLAGATPTGLALSSDESMLYASLGDMNAVAVIDLSESSGPEVEGYMPAGWYPTSVAVAGNQLLIINGKGDLARLPHDLLSKEEQATSGKPVNSPLLLYEGTLWRETIPSSTELAADTAQCLADARLTPQYLNGENPLDSISLQSGKIKHVIYIIKENRTYDQVLGDLPQGNGDLSRCLFPREVTPNLHALSERFVLFDNFYTSGEVSGDGWVWSTEAQGNEYTVRNVPYQYSHRGRQQDYEGSNNRYPVGGFPANLSDDPRFAQGGKPVPDVAESPGGHIWDMARRCGVSYRNYGFFLSVGVKNGKMIVIPDNYPASTGVQPGGHDLNGITDLDFRRFDLLFPDSDAPSQLARQSGNKVYLWKEQTYGQAKLPSRFSEWKREFDLMLARDPSGNSVPAFETVRLGTDHTNGAQSLKPTPRCMAADNDYAVGELVEAVSHSPIWSSTAIVIVEDDAQNGPDHVDGHRSTCYLISPWIKRGFVDHSYQNSVTVLRTIESLLNLPPMCQYDAAAGVLAGWDDHPGNAEPFDAISPSPAIMAERNPAGGPTDWYSPEESQNSDALPRGGESRRLDTTADLAAASADMDFTQADSVPADLLNRVIWKTVKGPTAEMPPTPHALAAGGKSDESDDGD